MINVLANIGNILLLLNIVLFLNCFSSQRKAVSIFTFYLMFVFVIQLSSDMMSHYRINNLYLSHFYFIGQFLVLALFYGTIFKTLQQKRTVKYIIFIASASLAIQYIFDPSQFFQFNLFEISLTSLLVVVLAVFYLYIMLTEKKEFYYVNMGIIIYLLTSTILFIAGNFMVALSPEYNKLPWILNAFLYIVYQLFITYEWYKSYAKENNALKTYNNDAGF